MRRWIFSQLVFLPFKRGFFARLKLLFCQEIRTQWLKWGNPSFSFDVSKVISLNASHSKYINHKGGELKVPFSYTLPIILAKQPFYSMNYPRIASYIHQEVEKFTLIDIGANIGDGVYLNRLFASFPILCIEGDEQYSQLLEHNISSHTNVYSVYSFVGKENIEIKGKYEKQDGTVAFVSHPTGDKKISMRTLASILEEKTMFKDFKMIKIDTDGYDVDIIRSFGPEVGNKPVIFFEYDPFYLERVGAHPMDVFEHLRNLSYAKMLVYDNFGFLICAISLNQKELLADLHAYMQGRKGKYYYDLCVFHAQDEMLFEVVYQKELEFFKQADK